MPAKSSIKAKVKTLPKPLFFADGAEFRRWLEANHATATELYIGFQKKASGKPGITYAQALDEALCFGWIDGVLYSLGAESHMQRYTPRKAGSIWSQINLGHVARLKKAGRMQPSGLAAFAARQAHKVGIYSYEQRPQALPAAYDARFRSALAAWAYWEKQPPGYRRQLIWWVISAKQEATRERRLATLIAACAEGRRLR